MGTKKPTTKPPSRRQRIRDYLTTHPGPHTADTIAAGIGETNKGRAHRDARPVTSELARMVREGHLVKYRLNDTTAGAGVLYAINERRN